MFDNTREQHFVGDPRNRKVLLELKLREARLRRACPECKNGCPACSKQMDVFRALAVGKVPLKFWDSEPTDFDNDKVRTTMSAYLKNIDHMWRKGWGLYLFGPNGTGKTMLASIVLKEAAKKGYQIHFTSLSEVISRYCDGMYDVDARARFEEDILRADFLVLDDIDKAYRSSNSDFMDSAYDYLFRTRANRCLPIITTANETRENFIQQADNGKAFGMSLLSLFSDTMLDVKVKGRDRRQGRLRQELEGFFNDRS